MCCASSVWHPVSIKLLIILLGTSFSLKGICLSFVACVCGTGTERVMLFKDFVNRSAGFRNGKVNETRVHRCFVTGGAVVPQKSVCFNAEVSYMCVTGAICVTKKIIRSLTQSF